MRAKLKGYLWIVSLLAALIFVARVQAASTVFVSQSGGSVSCGADGTQVTTALASVTWTAGNTYKICGPLTTRVNVTTGGSSASVLTTIQFETGASIGGAACTSTTALLTVKSFMLVDLGGNTAAIACPNNGVGLTNTNATIGISNGCTAVNGGLGLDAGFTNVEIRNGTIGPMFTYSGTSITAGAFSHGICLYGGNNNHFHNLTFSNAQHGIEYGVGNGKTSAADEIGHNNFSGIGDAIIFGAGDSNGSTTSVFIHDNDFTTGSVWGNPSDSTHIESIHIFTNGANSHFTGVEVYNNFTHGGWPSLGGTGCYFTEQGGTTGHNVGGTITAIMHDNICQLPTTGAAPGDGLFFSASNDMTITYVNNLLDCGANTHGIAFEGDVATGSTYTYENNTVVNCEAAIFTNGTPNATQYKANNNIYSGIGSEGWGNVGSFATWKSACACDAASSTSAPGLNSDYTITNAASLAHTLPGLNLTSLGDTTLLTGAPQTFGVTGACGANGCVARPSTGNWDVGPYPLGGTSPAPGVSFSPASIAFGTINTGTSAGPTTVTLTNTGTAQLTLSSSVISTNAVFTIGSNTCTSGTNIAAAGTCTFTVTFTPSGASTFTDTWTVTDNANGSPHTGALSGTGQTGGGGTGCPVGATFCDTFNEGTLDTTKWQVNAFTQPNYAGAGSTVTSQADHCDLTTGVLRSRLDQPTASTSTSCELQSKLSFGYGTYVWSIRASSTSTTPTGAGTTSSGSISTGFIIDGGTSITEIDSPEIEGQFPKQLEFTNWKNGANTGALLVQAAFNPQDAFHTYGFTWSAGQVQYFVDGVLVGTHTDADVPNGATPGFILISHYGTNSTGFGGLATVGVTRYQYCNLFAYTPPSAPIVPVQAPAAKLFASTVLQVSPQ